MHAQRPIRSFVLRAGRVTPAQERALTDLWPAFGLEFEGRPLDLDEVFGRARAALPRDRIRRRGGHRLPGEGTSRDRLSGHRGASRGRGPAAAACRAVEASPICASSATTPSRCCGLRFPDESFDTILIFFPDPWHKKRHHKRRLIDAAFVETLADKLRPNGVLRLATDWQAYAEQMLEVCNACARLGLAECGRDLHGAARVSAADAIRAARRAPGTRRVGFGLHEAADGAPGPRHHG